MTTVSNLFNIRYGHSLELNRLILADRDTGIAFVSRKMGDNGVSAFVQPIAHVQPASAGEVTVALSGNGVLSAFLQERPFFTGYHVAILSPKERMSLTALLYYCMCIKAKSVFGKWIHIGLARRRTMMRIMQIRSIASL
jgi:hypothetical protein